MVDFNRQMIAEGDGYFAVRLKMRTSSGLNMPCDALPYYDSFSNYTFSTPTDEPTVVSDSYYFIKIPVGPSYDYQTVLTGPKPLLNKSDVTLSFDVKSLIYGGYTSDVFSIISDYQNTIRVDFNSNKVTWTRQTETICTIPITSPYDVFKNIKFVVVNNECKGYLNDVLKDTVNLPVPSPIIGTIRMFYNMGFAVGYYVKNINVTE